MNVVELVEDLFANYTYFAPEAEDGEPILPVTWEKGSSDLWVIAGENATGKSFLRRLLQIRLKDEDGGGLKEVLRISMEDRGTGGYMPSFARTMIYGDEKHNSTGQNSINAFLAGLNTSKNREHDHAIIWDEPDVGMSESTCAGLGKRLAEFIENETTEHHKATFVISHSRPLLAQLSALDPHYIVLGVDAPPTLDAWLKREVVPRDPQDVLDASRKLRKEIQGILNNL